jgi:hypothetical protein
MQQNTTMPYQDAASDEEPNLHVAEPQARLELRRLVLELERLVLTSEWKNEGKKGKMGPAIKQ